MSAEERPRTAPEGRRRPGSAPPLQGSELDVVELDLESMTANAVALFQEGCRQEALEVAVAFSQAAERQLGRTHPDYINALATVAALVDRMGGAEEAKALLSAAENLHDELEMEVMEEQLDREVEEFLSKPAAEAPERTVADIVGEDTESGSEVANGGGEQGCLDGGSDADAELDPDGDLEDEEEAEAEAITQLTFEVNALLQHGEPEEAAKLISAAEKLLVRGTDVSALSAVTKAALHTLWAAVLDTIGEGEKARRLYDEALGCLEQELGCRDSDTSTSEESEYDSGAESSEASADPVCANELVPVGPPAKAEDKSDEGPAASMPSTELPAAGATPAFEPQAPPSKAGGQPNRRPAVPAPHSQVEAKAPPTQVKAAPSATRVGGGYVRPPTGPPPKPKAKVQPRRPPKVKQASAPAQTDPESKEQQPVQQPVQPQELPSQALAVEPPEEPEPTPPAVSSIAPAQSAEEQAAEASKALTCADHFLGLLNFEQSADVLEEQLVKLSSDDSCHKMSDLHVEVLRKYANVLWWDGDLDGSIDAFTAADEILETRDQTPEVRRQRADIWGQLAQVHRANAEFDAADRHLSEAVRCLEELAGMAEAGDAKHMDALSDAKAALGQVCVQKKEFGRAESLYVEAYTRALPQGADAGTAEPNAASPHG